MKSLFLSFLLCLSFLAHSADKPCAGDIKKFCPQLKGDRQAVFQCLATHNSELSSTCKQKVESSKKPNVVNNNKSKIAEIKKNCEAEITKYCAQKPHVFGVVGCLKPHQKDLSEKCSASLPNKTNKQLKK